MNDNRLKIKSHKYTTVVFVLIFLASSSTTHPQSLGGYSGLFTIPTAQLPPDREVTSGVSYIDKTYLDYTNHERNIISAYTSFTFLPFVELSLRINRQLKFEGTNHNFDRVPSIRFRITNDSGYLPAAVIGIHDFGTAFGGESAIHFHSFYVVFTKRMPERILFDNIEMTIGYGAKLLHAENYQFLGLFGGISFDLIKDCNLLLENDGMHTNSGIRITLLNHFRLLGGFMNFKHFSGGLSYYYSI